MDAVVPAALRRVASEGSSTPFAPHAGDTPPLAEYGYVQEEWFATGEEDGHPYSTTVLVRRPRDRARYSGVVIAEPLHVSGIAPIWIYSAPYLMRSGHAWVEVTAQKTTLDTFVKPSAPGRYESLHIEGPESTGYRPQVDLHDRESSSAVWADLARRNRASSSILAQVGAAIKACTGPFEDWGAEHVLLAGHSQTGSVVTYYIRDAHHTQRLADGSPVYDGYFPSGFPYDPFHDVDVPVVQVISEGDIAEPGFAFCPGYEGRRYRRPDSDEPADLFRLYELAGVSHMGSRYAPFNDPLLWSATHQDADVVIGPLLNSLPHFELFSVALHHLVDWAANGTPPPKADRIEIGPDDRPVADEHGNTRGGVRCIQLEVPHSAYRSIPVNADGVPTYFSVGNSEPFDVEKMRELYQDKPRYLERFDHRLEELINAGWLLAADADEMRQEARRVHVP